MLIFSKILFLFLFCILKIISCVKQESAESFKWNGKWFPEKPNSSNLSDFEDNVDNQKIWKGKWFPHAPHPDAEKNTKHNKVSSFKLKKHPDLIKMGIADPVCDDARTNLATDFDPYDITFHEEFLCVRPYKPFMPNTKTKARHLTYNIPIGYRFNHICMNESIEYKEDIPTYGDHRKLWAAWGEYKYLPKQRWIHNLEHGGIVMLYHQCALHSEVQKLRDIVENCLYRHIITPYSGLTPQRPLALLAWGNSIEMSVVSTEIAVRFIEKYALKAPEQLSDQGQYQHLLVKNATIISDIKDSRLCPYQYGINHDQNGPF